MLYRGTIKLAHHQQVTGRDFTAETISQHWGARARAVWLCADHVARNQERRISTDSIFVYEPVTMSTLGAFRTRDELAAWCRAYGAKTDRVPQEGAKFTVVLPSSADEMAPLVDDGKPDPYAYRPPTPDETVRNLVQRALTNRGLRRTETPSQYNLEVGRSPGFLVSGGIDGVTISQHPFPADARTLEAWEWAVWGRRERWTVRRGPDQTLRISAGLYGWYGRNEFFGMTLAPVTEPEQQLAPAYENFGRHRDGWDIRHLTSQAELAACIPEYLARGVPVFRTPGGVIVVEYESGRHGFYPLEHTPLPECARCQRFPREHMSWAACPVFELPV
ncbi:hypothetical protein AB0O57_29610 [Streptomyces sp. NPDC091201]|uniref:hypothetical protein n=1 Tax=Streptomyces sp. NPDC091201 TaxID=3155190 RepID=UPI003416BAEA